MTFEESLMEYETEKGKKITSPAVIAAMKKAYELVECGQDYEIFNPTKGRSQIYER